MNHWTVLRKISGAFERHECGIAVDEVSGSQKTAGFAEFGDDAAVGVTLLAVVREDPGTGEQGNIVEIAAVFAHGMRNLDSVGGAERPVFRTVTGSDVNESGSLVRRDMLACQQRDIEIVAPAAKRVTAYGSGETVSGKTADLPVAGDRAALHGHGCELGKDRDLLSNRGARFLFCVLDLDDAVAQRFAIGDRAVAGQRPGRRGPDDDRDILEVRKRGTDDRKGNIDHGRSVVVVFDLGFGECRPLDTGPHDGFRAAIELARHDELAELADDLCLGGVTHRRVGIVPVADHAQPLEFGALDVDPLFGELPALAPELDGLDLVLVPARRAVLLFYLPFDRQSVTVPAGNIVGVLAQHLLGTVDHILENLVEGVADMQVAIGVRRPVMEDEGLAAARIFAQQVEEADGLPSGEDVRFALGKAGAHGKGGIRQKQRLPVVSSHPGEIRRNLEKREELRGVTRPSTRGPGRQFAAISRASSTWRSLSST